MSLKISNSYQLVVSIDFGTTFSGYAYSYAYDKEAIYVNKNWGRSGSALYKTPTCLLLAPDGEFKAFGIEAVKQYSELEDPTEYYYFEHFKMKLYENKELNMDTILEDSCGRRHLGVDVFAKSLSFMQKHMLQAVKQSVGREPNPDTIRWVLTVPAIWDENAKQFMREAAYRGNLIPSPKSDQLEIALEPEAASIHCRNLPGAQFVDYEDNVTKPPFGPGTKYFVVDAGGGTIDCVGHSIEEDGKVNELFRATGGPWGGTLIDKEFLKLMYRIFGEEFIKDFQKKLPQDYLEMLQEFEKSKHENSESIRMTLPYDFCNFKHNHVSVQQAVKIYAEKNNNAVKFTSGKLVLTPPVVSSLFADALKQINEHVDKLLQKPNTADVKYIFLVGGFAESDRLQKSLRRHLGRRITCFIPEEASLAVVRGAVAFGHDSSLIWKRICRYTYGVCTVCPFEEGVHREDLKEEIEGDFLCNNIFYMCAEAGQAIAYNEIWNRTFTPPCTKQESIHFQFFRSSKQHVEYTDEVGLETCGSLIVKMPDLTGGKKRVVNLEVTFGGTEIKVVGHDKTTGENFETSIDFLS